MPRNSSNARWTEPGSALVMAALAGALLATAAGLMLIEARGARAGSGEALRLARAELEAEELLAQAVARLDSGDALVQQGVLFESDDGARVLRQDAAGLVDLNAAAPERLAALFVGLGASQEEAARLADAIADWRDEDDLKRLNGAERAEYEAAGRPAPANRPFETEGELERVLGARAELVACALSFLTTYSGQAEPDPAAAPPALLAHLGLQPEPRAGAGAPLGRVIALTAEAPISEHAALRRTLWLRLTGDPGRPVLIHRGAQELAPRGEAQASCAEPSP